MMTYTERRLDFINRKIRSTEGEKRRLWLKCKYGEKNKVNLITIATLEEVSLLKHSEPKKLEEAEEITIVKKTEYFSKDILHYAKVRYNLEYFCILKNEGIHVKINGNEYKGDMVIYSLIIPYRIKERVKQ